MKPQRIQRRRSKGWRLPPNTVCVTRPGKWGNPFRVADFAEANRIIPNHVAEHCVALFRRGLEFELVAKAHGQPVAFDWARRIVDALPELRGKNLACWCKPGTPCHADVLLEIANA
ncbi:MAG: DUF4326 domain-containing protein [Verrucomicrobia bacterium]|jgi:hypothetical protein|nr:DUF4326 domain-containing protein [Verrucomicrobiota bacterium]